MHVLIYSARLVGRSRLRQCRDNDEQTVRVYSLQAVTAPTIHDVVVGRAAFGVLAVSVVSNYLCTMTKVITTSTVEHSRKLLPFFIPCTHDQNAASREMFERVC